MKPTIQSSFGLLIAMLIMQSLAKMARAFSSEPLTLDTTLSNPQPNLNLVNDTHDSNRPVPSRLMFNQLLKVGGNTLRVRATTFMHRLIGPGSGTTATLRLVA